MADSQDTCRKRRGQFRIVRDLVADIRRLIRAQRPTSAYTRWVLSDAGAKEMRRVLDPNDPAGKPTMPIRAAREAGRDA